VKVVVALDRCLGNARCVAAAPEVFDVDDDEGTVVVLQQEPGASLATRVELAARSCPTGALSLLP
jgi:ferredoxin